MEYCGEFLHLGSEHNAWCMREQAIQWIGFFKAKFEVSKGWPVAEWTMNVKEAWKWYLPTIMFRKGAYIIGPLASCCAKKFKCIHSWNAALHAELLYSISRSCVKWRFLLNLHIFEIVRSMHTMDKVICSLRRVAMMPEKKHSPNCDVGRRLKGFRAFYM